MHMAHTKNTNSNQYQSVSWHYCTIQQSHNINYNYGAAT